MTKKEWQILSKQTVVEGKRRGLESWEVSAPNGTTHTFHMVSGPDVVITFAVTTDNKVLFIQEFFPSLMKKQWSLVGGMLEDGETPLENSKKELLEETGYHAEEHVHVGSIIKGKWTLGNVHFYLAKGARKVQKQQLEAAEDVDVYELSFEEFIPLLRGQSVVGTYDALCAYYALDRLGKL